MDVLALHRHTVERYQGYIRSFIEIRDDDIKREVIAQLDSGKLWPEPLIQFNPAYESGASIQKLVLEGVLRPELAEVFSGYQLYLHQEQALGLGAKKQSFVVTSGTGSGKSLTYWGTVFNSLFTSGLGKGVKALIVYPMNALINSQMEELRRYAENYQHSASSTFPISFNAYTGQTANEVRQEIIASPPDILLTNYMMLELLLTRAGEEQLRQSIFKTLEFLAFDELHTYRGRQGADVSYLIRRIKALAQGAIVCMGTSATMSSRGSIEEQKKVVADVASKIFGETVSTEQIIGEQLERSLEWNGTVPSGDSLATPIPSDKGLDALKSHPLAIWLENTAAIGETVHGLQRRKPSTAGDLITALMQASLMSQEQATAQILDLLNWIAAVNKRQTDQGERYTCLPFKLHQFFAQTGSVYATLGLPGSRTVSLEPGIYEGAENDFVFPHVFSRASGRTFICVHVDQQNARFLPREFNDTDARNGNDFGYILPEYSQNEEDMFWTGSQDDLAILPTSWTNLSTAGLKLKKDFQARAPREVYYSRQGYYALTLSEECPFKGWFMSAAKAGLLFDPTAGMFFEGNTNERTKLTTLGNEGRSTSTTITSFILLTQLAEAGFSIQDQKLLSFTDNRQDAALQSGHFNDFIRIVRIRSAIYFALKETPDNTLKSAQLGQSIRQSLGLDLSVYSDNPSAFPSERKAIDDCLERYLTYQAIHDLRRGWRVVLPNLEKCALLEIDYEDRVENAAYEEGWKTVPLFKDLSKDQRAQLLRDVLDYFRLEYAIISKTWLMSAAISENIQIIRSKLRPEWTIKSEAEIEAGALRRKRLHRRNSVQTSSLGVTSALGKYLKHYAKLNSINVDLSRNCQEDIAAFVTETNARWGEANSAIKTRLKAFNDEAKTRKAKETTLSQYSDQLVRLNAEIQELSQKAAARESEARQHDGEAKSLAAQIAKLDSELKPFVHLDADLKREQLKRDANRVGHERYLGAKKTADELPARQTRLTQLLGEESAAQKALLAARAAVQKAEQDFDPEKLKDARADHQTKHDRATSLQVSLAAEKEKLTKEEKRFKEWEEACKERDRISREIGRCEAAMAITELARRTLRDSAPAVAQHLCNRIASRAQGVFNQINPDPIELGWNAERYSLRVKPGDRRFAMLSGGEQTKLALAMTLAMIEEFSGLRFCIFDEPTYGVDADSRHKLADAIIQAQQAAGLNQLLLVSHDDAFEGKTEHAILLEKSAAEGTSVVLTQ